MPSRSSADEALNVATRPPPFSAKVTASDPVIVAGSMTFVTSMATMMSTEPTESVAVTISS